MRTESLWTRLAWYLPAGALLVFLPVFKYSELWWQLPRTQKIALLFVAGTFALACLATLVVERERSWSAAWRTLLRSLAILCVCVLAFIFTSKQSPLYLIAPLFACIAIVIPLSVSPIAGSRVPIALLGVLAVATAASAAVHLRSGPRSERVTKVSYLRSAFYVLQMTSREKWIPAPATRGGSLDHFGDKVLLATGDGHLYLVGVPAGDAPLTIDELPTIVPNNREEFAKAFGGSSRQPARSADFRETGAPRVQTWRFRVADVIPHVANGHVQLFASHHHFHPDQKCVTVQVSRIDVAESQFPAGLAEAQWETIFEAQPCLAMTGPNRKRGKNPFHGEEIGGKLAFLDDHTLLVTLGDQGFAGIESLESYAQDPDVSYGKTIKLDLTTNTASVFTLGHRNPQGLYIGREGKIWQTEHGSQGGDELNVLEAGTNYGWPAVTYGTDYGSMVWPHSKAQGRHSGFREPRYSWVPSIGVSQIMRIERDSMFPIWQGNFLVGSLATRSLYRLAMDGDRVVLSEPMSIGKRVRDVLELADGRLMLWTDDAALVTLEPARGMDGQMLFATQCSGCHGIVDGMSHRIGPDLHAIVGRDIAAAPGFDEYSPALRAQAGEWTKEKLDAFLRNPQGAVPGNGMGFAGISDEQQRKALIEYLQSAAEN